MTTAKPDRSDSSDDLIAELARMMAQEAQGPGSEPNTAPAKAPSPQSQAPSQSIPRIPGLPENQGGASASRPTLDFGAAPKAAPVIIPEPLSNWQNYSSRAPQPESAPRQEPQMSSPEPSRQADDFDRQPSQQRREPGFGFSNAPAPSPSVAAPSPRVEPAASNPADRDDGFGLGDDFLESTAPAPQAPVEPVRPHEPVRHSHDSSHDAIADLIAAELDEADAVTGQMDFDDTPLATEAGEENMFEAEPEQARAPEPAPQPQPTQPQGNPLLRPVNFTARETAPTDRFSVSPVFGLGGRANPKPIAPDSNVVPPNAPQEPSVAAERPSYAPPPREQAPAPRQEPIMPRHQPIGPAMAAIAPNIPADPIDEIESLIGDAVRVEMTPRQKSPTPVVSSLNAPFAPQRTSIPLGNSDPRAMTSEDAILAAAAASGAEVDSWDTRSAPPVKQGRDKAAEKKEKAAAAKAAKAAKAAAADEERATRRGGGMRQYIGPAVAGTLLLVAGFGLYWVLGLGHTDGKAPVLTADPAAVKEMPAAPTPDANAPSGSVVFNEIDGGAAAANNQEQIVSRDQTSGDDVARVIAPEGGDETGLANRKVRTVTVRPDGTIVSAGTDALAGSEVLPVDRPNVPAVPGQTVDASDLLTGVSPTQPAAPDAALTGTPAVTATPTPTTPTFAPGAPVPMPRPTSRNGNASIDPQPTSPVNALVADVGTTNDANSQIVDLIGNLANDSQPAAATVRQVAAVQPEPTPAAVKPVAAVQAAPVAAAPQAAPVAAAPQAAPTTPAKPAAQQVASTGGASAPAYVQLSSQRSENDAVAAMETVKKRYGSLFGNTQLEVKRVDLGQKGVYYRVRLPAASMQSANQICSNVKAAGGDCYIPPN